SRSTKERTSSGPSPQYAGANRSLELSIRSRCSTERTSPCRVGQWNYIQCGVNFIAGFEEVQAKRRSERAYHRSRQVRRPDDHSQRREAGWARDEGFGAWPGRSRI